MRAVVLSNDRIIKFLNENFINTWVSNVELERTPFKQEFMALRRQQGFKPFDKTHPLAQAIMKGWKKHSPSDSLILSPDLELMGRQPVNELSGDWAGGYLTFLKESLAGKLAGFAEETPEPQSTGSGGSHNSDAVPIGGLNVVLTPQKLEQESLSIFRTPKRGYQDYTVVEIDTTAFKDGGVLTIDISVGSAEPAGSFDLYAGDTELPTEGMPHGALASAWDVPSGETGTIKYRFNRGKVFKLGGTGSWFSEEGSINAFLAKISVEPDQKPEPKKVSSARSEQSAEDVMNTFVEAFKNLDSEIINSMLTGDAREEFDMDTENLTEDMRTQFSQILRHMEILSSEYVGDEFHFRLRVPGSNPPEVSVKMRKVEGIWLIYDAK
ncbi:MAG: hypothetical protein OXH39_03480 [Candidatus Poribacteria bacterium]|nr:hypothetical protein [Candidatus Poribacteria bacterium]